MISSKRLRSGLSRLGVVLGVVVAIVTLIALGPPTRSGALAVHAIVSVIAGILTWVAVRGVAWVIEGFRDPESN